MKPPNGKMPLPQIVMVMVEERKQWEMSPKGRTGSKHLGNDGKWRLKVRITPPKLVIIWERGQGLLHLSMSLN